MKVDKIKRLASDLLKCGKNKVWFDPENVDKIQEAITKEDVRALIKEGIIRERNDNEQSRGRARVLKGKKAKGRKRGFGKRGGTKKARGEKHKRWIANIRSQRKKLTELREKHPKEVSKIGYTKLYKKVKGGFFKGKKYIEALVKKGVA